MRIRNVWWATISLVLVSVNAPAYALTQQELIAKLAAAGYKNVSDVKSTAEGISAKATKDGKEVHLVVDSGGQIKEQPQQ